MTSAFYIKSDLALQGLQILRTDALSRTTDLLLVMQALPFCDAILERARAIAHEQIERATHGLLPYLLFAAKEAETALTEFATVSCSNHRPCEQKVTHLLDLLENAPPITEVPQFRGPCLHLDNSSSMAKHIHSSMFSATALSSLDTASSHSWLAMLAGADRILTDHLDQRTTGLVKSFSAVIVPIYREFTGSSLSGTSDALPQVLCASWVPPKNFAECLVHETAHTALNLICTLEQLTLNDRETHYSPFRTDSRPTSGLLHAAYSFHNICLLKHELSGAPRRLGEWATESLGRDLLRTLVAARGLKESEELAPVGREIVETISKSLEQICADRNFITSDNIRELEEHFRNWQHANGTEVKSACAHEAVVEGTCMEFKRRTSKAKPAQIRLAVNEISAPSLITVESISDLWAVLPKNQPVKILEHGFDLCDTLQRDLENAKDARIAVIDIGKYKGRTDDARAYTTLGDAMANAGSANFLTVRNFERFASFDETVLSHIEGNDFIVGRHELHLFMNFPGLNVPTHCDSSDNLHLMIEGKKTFWLSANFTGSGSIEFADGFDGFQPFIDRDQALETGEFVELVAGEALYLPKDIWHSVSYTHYSTAVSVFDEISESAAVMPPELLARTTKTTNGKDLSVT